MGNSCSPEKNKPRSDYKQTVKIVEELITKIDGTIAGNTTGRNKHNSDLFNKAEATLCDLLFKKLLSDVGKDKFDRLEDQLRSHLKQLTKHIYGQSEITDDIISEEYKYLAAVTYKATKLNESIGDETQLSMEKLNELEASAKSIVEEQTVALAHGRFDVGLYKVYCSSILEAILIQVNNAQAVLRKKPLNEPPKDPHVHILDEYEKVLRAFFLGTSDPMKNPNCDRQRCAATLRLYYENLMAMKETISTTAAVEEKYESLVRIVQSLMAKLLGVQITFSRQNVAGSVCFDFY